MLDTRERHGLDKNNHQGKFGVDYIRVLASAAGLLWSQDDVDLDGVDLSIKLPGRTRRGHSPRIEVQVKTVSRPEIRRGALNYDGLNHAQFNKLAGPDFTVPRYLFLIHVPTAVDGYAGVTTAGLLLQHIGYYLSLSDRTPLPSHSTARSIRVKVPVAQVLTAHSLRTLIIGDATGATE